MILVMINGKPAVAMETKAAAEIVVDFVRGMAAIGGAPPIDWELVDVERCVGPHDFFTNSRAVCVALSTVAAKALEASK